MDGDFISLPILALIGLFGLIFVVAVFQALTNTTQCNTTYSLKLNDNQTLICNQLEQEKSISGYHSQLVGKVVQQVADYSYNGAVKCDDTTYSGYYSFTPITKCVNITPVISIK